MPRFLHAADIHLDSPLQRLEAYEGAPVEKIRGATRRALRNLVDAALDRSVDFVLIAGDLYDGDWRDQQTGLFFVGEAARLINAGIPLYVIRGNHDAANVMTRSLPLPRNPDGTAILLSDKRVDSVRLENVGVSIHGRSFGQRAEKENLAAEYPAADAGMFNIGLLHTSLEGAEGHDCYAPCSARQLADHGYQYWALGHIHLRGERQPSGAAPIVFPGNVQGRHVRETGAKGCSIVEFDSDGSLSHDFLPLDVMRWEVCTIDVSRLQHIDEIEALFDQWLASMLPTCEQRSLIARIRLVGSTPLHSRLIHHQWDLENRLRAIALDRGTGEVWLESVRVRSELPSLASDQLEGPLASVFAVMENLRQEEIHPGLEEQLAPLRRLFPAEFEAFDFNSLWADAQADLIARLKGDL